MGNRGMTALRLKLKFIRNDCIWLKNRIWLLVFYVWPFLAFGQTINLNAINQNPHNKIWNIYFVSTAPVTTKQFSLLHPNRLVLDITGANRLHVPPGLIASVPSPIKQIRSSANSEQTLRIVLDLKPNTTANSIHIHFDKLSAATSVQTVSNTMPSNHRSRQVIVVIDPGHGGKDPGATGLKKIHEKDVVLGIAKKLQILINQQSGFKAVLTRNGDYYLTLRQRLAIARQNKADMFIAIHADAYPDPLAHGVSVFALSQRGATSEAARWLAARENQSELMGGVDLNDKEDMLRSVLINLSQTATIQASLLIGQNLLDDVRPFAHLHHAQIEQAAFVVLKSPDIPSLLVETGFLSNSKEEEKLRSPAYQYNLARAMMLGIKEYFIRRPPPGTLLAARKK